MNRAIALAPWMWVCTILLAGRVIGQLVVWTRAPRWLPPMEQWQSGLLPYPVLLTGQVVVLVLMMWIAADFSRGAGVFIQPLPRLGTAALWWSTLYASAMVVRYLVRMTRRPDQRWWGGTIPIIFHCVVAVFQFTFGWFQTSAP